MGGAGISSRIPLTPGLAPPGGALTISTAIRNIGGGGLDPGHDLRQVREARTGEGQHLWVTWVRVSEAPWRPGCRGTVPWGHILRSVLWSGSSEKPREIWGHLRFGRPRGAGGVPAYVCTAALDKVSRPPVCEHLLNDVAPAPAPKHSLPVLVAHILQEGRGLGPSMLRLPQMFPAWSSLLSPTLPAPGLAPQKPAALGALAFEANPILESAICSTLGPCPPSCAPARHYQPIIS